MHKSSHDQYKSQNTGPTDGELSRAGNKIVHDLHNLRNDAQTLGKDLKGATHAVGDAVRHTGTQVRDTATTVIHAPVSLIESMRSAPVKSAAIAMFIGLVFGRLYRR